MTGDVAALVPTTVRIDDKALPLGTRVGETERRAVRQGCMWRLRYSPKPRAPAP